MVAQATSQLAPPTPLVTAYTGARSIAWAQGGLGQPRCLMRNFLSLKTPMAGFQVERLLQHAHTDTLQIELDKSYLPCDDHSKRLDGAGG